MILRLREDHTIVGLMEMINECYKKVRSPAPGEALAFSCPGAIKGSKIPSPALLQSDIWALQVDLGRRPGRFDVADTDGSRTAEYPAPEELAPASMVEVSLDALALDWYVQTAHRASKTLDHSPVSAKIKKIDLCAYFGLDHGPVALDHQKLFNILSGLYFVTQKPKSSDAIYVHCRHALFSLCVEMYPSHDALQMRLQQVFPKERLVSIGGQLYYRVPRCVFIKQFLVLYMTVVGNWWEQSGDQFL